MKKSKLMLAAALMFGAWALPANALTGTAIYVNGQYLPMDAMPLIAEDTTFVPLRAVSEALGADVSWANGQATIEQGGQLIVLTPNHKLAQVNGKAEQLVAAPRLQGDRVLVPLRFVSEQLGARVDYADHQIDIAVAEDMTVDLPLHYDKCSEDGQYIYLVEGYDGTLTKIDKNTGERSYIEMPNASLLLIAPADDMIFYHHSEQRADGGFDTWLCAANINDGGETRVALNGGTPRICGDYLYYLVNNLKTGAHDLYRVKLVDGKPDGEAALVNMYVHKYFFAGNQVYTMSEGGKVFRANLDGSGNTEIVPPTSDEKLYFQDFDSGYFYYSDYNRTKLYRFKQPGVGGGSVPELVRDFKGTEIDRFADMDVKGNKIYFKTMTYAEYTEGRYGVVTGPLYAMDLDGGNLQKLTGDKALQFYVLNDKIVYQTQVNDGYPQVGGNYGAWRLIDK